MKNKNKMENKEEVKEVIQPTEVQEVQEVINPKIIEPVEEGKRAVNRVEEPSFNKENFLDSLKLAISHFSSIYGQTRDTEAAEIAKSCGTILAKVLSRA